MRGQEAHTNQSSSLQVQMRLQTPAVSVSESQCVSGAVSGWMACLSPTPENILSTPPLCGWQLPRQKLPRPYEQRLQKAASHTLCDAGCWLHVDQNPEQRTKIKIRADVSQSAAVGWDMFSPVCLMAVDQWGKIFLDSLSLSTVYPSAGCPCDWGGGMLYWLQRVLRYKSVSRM